MKLLIIIADPEIEEVLKNAIQTATKDLQTTEDIKKLQRGVWLVDAHTSFSFVAMLVHGANVNHLNISVLSVDDTPILLNHKSEKEKVQS